jgi:CelD/BcsL family acetyltransferase involved in cellulose biosynthesis
MRSIWNSLREREADLAFLSYVPVGSPLFAAASEPINGHAGAKSTAAENHRVASLPTDPDELWSRLSTKVRKNLRWQARKLLKDFSGKVRVVRFSGVSDLEGLIRDIEVVARKTYQRGLGGGFVNNEEMRQRLALAALENWLCAYVLYIDGAPRAFWIGTIYHGTFHSDYMGYDAGFGKYSPGMFLVMKGLEELAEHAPEYGVKQIDFGTGDAQYKEVLGTALWQDASAYIFSPGLRGSSLRILWTSTQILDRTARWVLDAGGRIPRIKKLWRTRARTKLPLG